MDVETVDAIARRFPWSSWALWDEDFPDGECVEQTPANLATFITSHRELLTTDIVLLGLNRSDELPGPFSNFHAPTRKHYDYRLKEFIQDGNLERLQGAYMTDLVDEVEVDSGVVQMTEEDAHLFIEQLQLLDEAAFHVICFGIKPFEALVAHYGGDSSELEHEIRHSRVVVEGITVDLYRVWFYGLYGANQSKVEVLNEQLRYLDRRL